MSFRRETLLEVGGVDEGLVENAIHWEIDLCCRVRAAGGRIVHDPRCRVHHLRYPTGGVRMGRVRPPSFFDNTVRVVWRHVPPHQRAVVVWRLLRDHVILGSGGCPYALGVMGLRMLKALVRVVRDGPAPPRLPLTGHGGNSSPPKPPPRYNDTGKP